MHALPGHLRAPITARTAKELAKHYEYDSIAEMANCLPQDGHILDVGAGHSGLGQALATARPDITWYNFDYSYGPDFVRQANRLTPNVRYIGGDVLHLSEYFEPQTFDGVFSYWLLPHLGIEGPEATKAAATQMYTVAKDDALLQFGPNLRRFWTSRNTHSWEKGPGLSTAQFAEEVDAAVGVRGLLRFVLHSLNLPEKRSVTERVDIGKVRGDIPPLGRLLTEVGTEVISVAGQMGIFYGSVAQYPFHVAYTRAMISINEQFAAQEAADPQ